MQSQVRLNGVPEKVPEVPGSLGAKPSQVHQVPEKIPEKVWEVLEQPGQAQQGSEEGLGSFGAEPGQGQQDLMAYKLQKLS